MNKTENRRVRLTKQMIKDSFIDLLKEKNIRKITVRELCQVADVNRATFYKYYKDPYDLMDEIMSEFKENVNIYLGEVDLDMVTNLTKALQYIADNRDICNMFLFNNPEEYIPTSILSLPSVSASILQNFPDDDSTSLYTREFVISGSYSVIVKWMSNDCKEPALEIAELIQELARKFAAS